MSEVKKVYGLVSRLPAIRPETKGFALEQTFVDERNAREAFSHCMAKNPGVDLWLVSLTGEDDDPRIEETALPNSSHDSADVRELSESVWQGIVNQLLDKLASLSQSPGLNPNNFDSQ